MKTLKPGDKRVLRKKRPAKVWQSSIARLNKSQANDPEYLARMNCRVLMKDGKWVGK